MERPINSVPWCANTKINTLSMTTATFAHTSTYFPFNANIRERFFLFFFRSEQQETNGYSHFREWLWFGFAESRWARMGCVGIGACGQKIISVIKIILKIKETCVLWDGCRCWCYCCCCCDYIILLFIEHILCLFGVLPSWERLASFIWSW